MSNTDDTIWSNTDFPYACLVDKKRTEAFRLAIKNTVKPGDTVLDVGSGSGILSFFAAAAGAGKILAIEIDHLLADSLKKSVKLNNLENVIEVIEGNVLDIDLPKGVDVVIAELIETGLLDEMQVSAMNDLHRKGVIGSNTKLIPQAYETFVQLVSIDSDFYGYKIAAPIHDWPYYSKDPSDWVSIKVSKCSDNKAIGYFDFNKERIEPMVQKVIGFDRPQTEKANAIRLSGVVHLTDNIQLDACNTLNGDKIIPLNVALPENLTELSISYKMSAGLDGFKAGLK